MNFLHFRDKLGILSLCVCAHTVWVILPLIGGSQGAPSWRCRDTVPALQGLRWTRDSSNSIGEPLVLTESIPSLCSSFSFKIPSMKADKGKQTDPAELGMGWRYLWFQASCSLPGLFSLTKQRAFRRNPSSHCPSLWLSTWCLGFESQC